MGQFAIVGPPVEGGGAVVESTGGIIEVALGAIGGSTVGVPIAVQANKRIEMAINKYFLFIFLLEVTVILKMTVT
jgi:hypothetical protein